MGHIIIIAIVAERVRCKGNSKCWKVDGPPALGREGLVGHMRDAIVVIDVNVHDILQSTFLFSVMFSGRIKAQAGVNQHADNSSAAAADNNGWNSHSYCSTCVANATTVRTYILLYLQRTTLQKSHLPTYVRIIPFIYVCTNNRWFRHAQRILQLWES